MRFPYHTQQKCCIIYYYICLSSLSSLHCTKHLYLSVLVYPVCKFFTGSVLYTVAFRTPSLDSASQVYNIILEGFNSQLALGKKKKCRFSHLNFFCFFHIYYLMCLRNFAYIQYHFIINTFLSDASYVIDLSPPIFPS